MAATFFLTILFVYLYSSFTCMLANNHVYSPYVGPGVSGGVTDTPV